MSRFKKLSILAGMLVALGVSAAPACAWWESTQSQGQINVTKSGAFHDGGAEVSCLAEDIIGQTHIQAKGQIKLQQEHTTKGPHLNIQVKSWGKCISVVAAMKLSAEIKPCGLQLVQQKGSFKATAGVVEPCLIKVGESKSPLCEIQIPAGMEGQAGSNKGINVGLSEVELENVAAEQNDKINIEHGGTGQLAGDGIMMISLPGHPLCPLATNEEATLTGLELRVVSAKAI